MAKTNTATAQDLSAQIASIKHTFEVNKTTAARLREQIKETERQTIHRVETVEAARPQIKAREQAALEDVAAKQFVRSDTNRRFFDKTRTVENRLDMLEQIVFAWGSCRKF